MFLCPCIWEACFFPLPRMCVCVCVYLWKMPLLLWGHKRVLIQHGHRPFCALTVSFTTVQWNVFTDSTGDAVWTLCGLVGSGGAAVWDAVRTRPLWGREWRWSLWVHPQWRGHLCILAQHRGHKHTQSSKSVSSLCFVHSRLFNKAFFKPNLFIFMILK